MAFLGIHNISLAYDNKTVVRNATFSVAKGEIVVILGASGDGKTTLLKGVGGFLPLTKGDITIDDQILEDANDMLIPGHEQIRLVNQDFSLDNYHTVEENIRLKLLRFDKEYQQSRIQTLMRLTGLGIYKNQKAIELSGGQQQRLAIARALADEPDVLLLDEPFNQLDFQTKTKISKHIKKYLQKNNIAALMVTHNGVEAMEWADRVVYLEKGKVKRIATPLEFFDNPRSLREASFFGKINKLKIKDQFHYFRPSFYALTKSQKFSIKLSVEYINHEFLGWYSVYSFKHAGQGFVLYSTEDLKELKEVFIKTFQFNA